MASFSIGVWLYGARGKQDTFHALSRCSAISKPRTQGTLPSLINYYLIEFNKIIPKVSAIQMLNHLSYWRYIIAVQDMQPCFINKMVCH
jgi:hypothetical protein